LLKELGCTRPKNQTNKQTADPLLSLFVVLKKKKKMKKIEKEKK